MVFIVQCPHPECRKFMLLEDSARGASVPCIKCKMILQVSASDSGERAKAPPLPVRSMAPSAAEAIPSAPRQKVINCPQCKALLRLPPTAENRAMRCPRCQTVFDGNV
jgi:LSD1 subclass zinc finger protein